MEGETPKRKESINRVTLCARSWILWKFEKWASLSLLGNFQSKPVLDFCAGVDVSHMNIPGWSYPSRSYHSSLWFISPFNWYTFLRPSRGYTTVLHRPISHRSIQLLLTLSTEQLRIPFVLFRRFVENGNRLAFLSSSIFAITSFHFF